MIIINAFSLNMLDFSSGPMVARAIPTTVERVRQLVALPHESAVGHADTARVFSQVLGIDVPCERRTVTLEPGEVAIVGQYRGPRLPEGATELPEGATIEWFYVEIWTEASSGMSRRTYMATVEGEQ